VISTAYVEVRMHANDHIENPYFTQIIEDQHQKALQPGSEDPQSAEILQKCEEFLPGQVE
jgi:hypothetical protein